MKKLDEDSIVEDLDLTFKLYKTGGKVMYAPEAIARTYCPGNWSLDKTKIAMELRQYSYSDKTQTGHFFNKRDL